MTLKLAIIGTSHVTALYNAWNEIGSDFGFVEPTFFAAPRNLFRHFVVSDAKLFGILDRSLFTPHDIHLMMNTFDSLTIDLAQFDAVLHVGLLGQETKLAELIGAFSIDGLRAAEGLPRLSYEAYDSFVQALAEAVTLPEGWHHWNAPRLYTLPAPRVAEICVSSEHSDYTAWRALLPHTDPKLVAHLLEDYTNRMIACHAAQGIRTLTPPPQVFAENGLTREELHKSALQLRTNDIYPSDNHRHMNTDYGIIVLRHVLDIIKKDTKTLTVSEASISQTV